MLAFRTTWYVKPGKMARAVEILMAEGQRFEDVRKSKGVDVKTEARIFTPMYSPDALILEICVASFADHEAYWASYDRNSEAGQVFWKEWFELIDHKGDSEVWEVHTR